MLTIYSDDHHLHHGAAELIDGTFKPCFEMPSRADMVLARARAVGLGDVISPVDFGLAPIRRVHSAGFVNFLQNAWSDWQALGRSHDMLPMTWPIRRLRDIEPGDIDGKLGFYSFDAGAPITACLSLYKTTGDEKYLEFSKEFIDYFVQPDGSIKTYDPKEYNLDNVNQGKNLFVLYDIYGDEKYRKAIDTIRSQLLTQPRTKEGNFWHKDIYPWQVWLDGTYMAQPFYMEYETRFNKMQGCIDSYKQFMNIKKHMRDEKTGLYYHGYDESRQMYWADPETGCSPNFWLRAMGWFLVAMVDVLERMDEQLYNEYRGIMAMLKQTVEDMHKFQDEQSGMFWQVIDHPEAEGNYLETSGTALFAYAVLKGVRLGYLPKRMAAWAEKAFYGTCDRYLSKNPDGSLQLDGICLVAGLGGKDHRDGSLAYYFSEPVVCNDAKGVGPLVLAYTEMIARK